MVYLCTKKIEMKKKPKTKEEKMEAVSATIAIIMIIVTIGLLFWAIHHKEDVKKDRNEFYKTHVYVR